MSTLAAPTATTTRMAGRSVSIRGLTKLFGETAAVDDLSLEIESGELVVLLGPSGCGKTTTMRCVVGLEQPQAGTIRIGDQVAFDAERGIAVPANKRNVGMVFQSYAIWPHMTVFDNVAFPVRIKTRSKTEVANAVANALSIVGLADYAERPASKLSGGQMQRVALARSIAMEPDVLLLDEPLSNLDARLRDSLRFELRELQMRLGLTAIYVTHDQSEAMALGDKIAVMRDGVIVQLDDPATIYRHPNSVYVADFLGVHNLLPGVITSVDGDMTVVRLAGSDHSVTSSDPGTVGDEVTVCVRPEDIVLDTADDGSTDTTFDGVVAVTNFLGGQTRYRIDLGNGVLLEVSLAGIVRPLTRGDRVTVRLPRACVQLLEG